MDHQRRKALKMLPVMMVSAGFAKESAPLRSLAYRFQDMEARTEGGNTYRSILQGLTHTGFPIEAHQTDLAPGGMPHPPHHHAHEEMFLLREGELEVNIEGRSTRLGPGGVAFVASNQEHGIRNAGTTHAQYFVIAFGNDAS